MKTKHAILYLFSVTLFIAACSTHKNKRPDISFDTYKIADGFDIQLAAAEPQVEAPVAMDFDERGRMWVVEMRGFMPNLAGTGDDAPTGRISILEDKDGDGIAEQATLFLDSLILPRALAHVYGGVLYTAPPNLWFVEINNDKPGKKTLVDSLYAVGGSPEAQPNGLLMNIDNWIYSANSHFRYQLRDGKWIKEPTSFRGQFGIAKDNFGRLYYNYNEIQIAGDYVLPNTIIGNPYLKPDEGINELLTENQRVYPLHPTTVNRGYSSGILGKDSLLLNVTAACGPAIYRGDQFPNEYSQNYFACEPQANLVKRDILSFDSIKTTATQAWSDREFLASTDEGFRPVNLFNGPDGALYVVDMHRGVMEYKAFTTPYYNAGISGKKLDTLLHAGRILRIKNKSKDLNKVPDLSTASGAQLVDLLKSTNGWVRDRAQQLLIYKGQKSAIPQLEQLAQNSQNEITAIHALRTLEGLHTLSFAFLQKVASAGGPMLTAHALLLLQNYSTKENVAPMATLATNLHNKHNNIIDLYLASSLGAWAQVSTNTFLPMLAKISESYPSDVLYQEAVVSSLKGLEDQFRTYVSQSAGNSNSKAPLDSLLAQVKQNKGQEKMNSIFVQVTPPVDARTNGLAIFRNTCATCHGVDGEGIEHIGPPLKGSAYVSGSADRLAMIILNGLEGPIHVNGKLYHFNGSMPNFGNNFSDGDIEDIIRYLHNAYVATPVKPIKAEEIKSLRKKNTGTLTEKELLMMDNGRK